MRSLLSEIAQFSVSMIAFSYQGMNSFDNITCRCLQVHPPALIQRWRRVAHNPRPCSDLQLFPGSDAEPQGDSKTPKFIRVLLSLSSYRLLQKHAARWSSSITASLDLSEIQQFRLVTCSRQLAFPVRRQHTNHDSTIIDYATFRPPESGVEYEGYDST